MNAPSHIDSQLNPTRTIRAPCVLLASSDWVPHWTSWDHVNESDRKEQTAREAGLKLPMLGC